MSRQSSVDVPISLAALLSALLHGVFFALCTGTIFVSRPNNELLMNIEIAGAAEMQSALDEYEESNKPIITNPDPVELPEPEKPEIIPEEPTPEPEPPVEEQQPTEQPEQIAPPQEEPIPEATPEPNPDEELLRLDAERKAQEEQQRQEELLKQQQEELLKQKQEEERLLREQQKKLEEEKRRLEEEKKKLEEKKQAEIKKQKELAAIKRLEEKKKERKKRLAKIANAVKKSEQKKKDSAFSKMLSEAKKDLARYSGRSRSSSKSSGGQGNGLGKYGSGFGMNDSDAAIISSQVTPHWVVPGGVKNANSLIIKMRIKLRENGEVIPNAIEILDSARYNSDYVFRAAADSARRAVLEASPFKVPADKMHLFRDFEFSFNTDKALGG